MLVTFAEGGNYRIDIVHQVARFRLWRRPDLDSEAGARLAEEARDQFQRLAATNESEVRGLLMDLREGPVVAGPVTQQHVGRMLTIWASCNRPLAVLVGDAPIQLLQYRRMVSEHCPRIGNVFDDMTLAEQWLSDRPPTQTTRRVRT